jgi:hypothetical protein
MKWCIGMMAWWFGFLSVAHDGVRFTAVGPFADKASCAVALQESAALEPYLISRRVVRLTCWNDGAPA